MNIICFGDSITHARSFAECDRWSTIVQYKLDVWRPGEHKLYNRGLGGNTTAQGLERMNDDVLPLLPGLLLVQFGFNDANMRPWSQTVRVGLEDYERNLREFHRIATVHQSQCVFIVNHSIVRDQAEHRMPDGRTYQDMFAPYNKVVRRVAQDLQTSAIDLPNSMRQRGIAANAMVSQDGLHLNVTGNHLYAEMVFEALTPILI
jgi:acyl-CoA thioesterase-1